MVELTPKQREVAKHLKVGARPAEAAKAMGNARSTMRMHLHGIKRFYGTSTYTEAVEKAIRKGDP